MSVLDWNFAWAPLAILDVETTGRDPRRDRIVEAAVVRIDPRRFNIAGTSSTEQLNPTIAFDSLINPGVPVSYTHVHGISDEDLRDAPRFEAIAALLIEALADAVVVAHNATFDLEFLCAEFRRLDIDLEFPYLCTMELTKFLGLTTENWSLKRIVQWAGRRISDHHTAGQDALALTGVVANLKGEAAKRQRLFFRDFNDDRFKFCKSLKRTELSPSLAARCRCPARTKSRLDPLLLHKRGSGAHVQIKRQSYHDALASAVDEGNFSDDTVSYLQRVRREWGLSEERVRAAHAHACIRVMSKYVSDDVLDDYERERLARLFGFLAELGWAPGE